ncbi:MAG: protein kinase [Solirubrobacterales bacterium]
MRQAPEPGDVFEGHEIEGVIGRGGMGIVLRARSVALDRPRAIKVIAPEISADPAYAARFRRESRLAASVEHPNVVPVYAAGEDDGLLFIVMRLVEGVDLHRLIADGPLPPERTLPIIRDVAAGLDAAHRAGLVHRDVKPANVLIEPAEGGEHVYLTDFGIAKPTATKTASGREQPPETSLTIEGEILGTADYVAPEQVEHGVADARSDVYSLACVAFHALTGAPPFRRDTDLATLIAQTKAPRPRASELVPTLGPEIDAALQGGMAIDPDERPGSAGAFAAELEAAVRGEVTPLARSRPGAADPHEKPTARLPRGEEEAAAAGTRGIGGGAGNGARGRGWKLAAFAAALVLVVAVAAAVLLLGGDDDGDGNGAPSVITEPVGEGPVGIAVGDQRVWVAARDAEQAPGVPPGEVDRLLLSHPVEKRGKGPIPVPGPKALATGLSSVWVVNGESLFRLGGSREVVAIPAGQEPDDVAVDPNYVWVSDFAGDAVIRFDPSAPDADGMPGAKTIPVCDGPRSIDAEDGLVWVACAGAENDPAPGEVDKIDAADAEVVDSVEVGTQPTSIAAGPSSVWVADQDDNLMREIDVRTAKLSGEPIQLEPGPRGVAVGFGSIWVASGPSNVVERFDAQTREPIGDPIEVGVDPADIAVGESAVYTANQGNSTVSRIVPP